MSTKMHKLFQCVTLFAALAIFVGCQKPTPPGGKTTADNGGDSSTEAPADKGDRADSSGNGSSADIEPVTSPGDDKGLFQVEVKKVDGRIVSGDWPMWGGTVTRNMVNPTTDIPMKWDVESGENILWKAELGSQSYANPVVASGRVFVGTNNALERRPQHKGDRGVVMCFDEKSGEFLWQLTREKLPQGRVNDWPEQGICSAIAVEGDRGWVITNRAELMCVDIEGFYDGENDGPYTEEADKEKQDADIVWSLDMINELGVFPHNLATSSPLVYGDVVYLLTSNGVDEAHLTIPSPRSPSFLAVNKNTGEIVWEDNTPFDKILHGQWSSPAVGYVNGKAQIYMPGGDGWLYAFDPLGEEGKSKLIWKFDLNPKESKWELGGRGDRNNIISTPVFYDNSVVLAVGQDPEHGEGVGHLYRIDCTKTGDVSPVTPDGKPNENSAQIWHFGGVDENDEPIYRRTMSTVSIHDGLVYAPTLSGFVHCIDFETGKGIWEDDLLGAVWGSTMVVDGKVFIGDEDGDVRVLATGREKKKLHELNMGSSVYSTPTIAGGHMFISTRNMLYCIGKKE